MNDKKVVDITPTPKASPKGIIKSLIGTLIFALISFYISLPAVNLRSEGFYIWLIILLGVYVFLNFVFIGRSDDADFEPMRVIKRRCKPPVIIAAVLVLVMIVGAIISATIFRASAYTALLNVETGDFTQDVEEISFDQIPMLDKDSAQKLGDRKLGELADMVSQFEVSGEYAQINYQDRPVRVTPLLYADAIKWLGNRASGIPAYIMLDMVTQEAVVVRLDEGMKYSNSEHFGRNLTRHLRFNYPTYMFDTPTFEVNDEGQPYWICPRIVKTIGLFGGTDINGAVLVNAVTGESEYYESVPEWVDRLYSAELLIQQYDYHGVYAGGYWNAIFGQKNVTVTTDGYNYIAMNDDVYVYTGITSVTGDESNVGFVLINQRTKETKYYAIAGAEEYSAMSSAQGVVQHLGYTATFPLLLNISDQPTYFIALKDNAQLVKMFAMVNVQQYQVVATGATVSECEAEYNRLLAQNNISEAVVLPESTASGSIAEIRSAVIDGNSIYYLLLEGDGLYYRISAADSELAPLLNVGDSVTIEFTPSEGEDVVFARSVELS